MNSKSTLKLSNFDVFPEWSDHDISVEKFNSKHAFEDDSFTLTLPGAKESKRLSGLSGSGLECTYQTSEITRLINTITLLTKCGDVLSDNVHPRKDSLPIMNASGKYIVKLFFMNAWRRVVVDDKVPVDSNGRVMIPGEWLIIILIKSIIKVTSIMSNQDIVQLLRGYIPEHIPPKALILENLLLTSKIYPKQEALPSSEVSIIPFGTGTKLLKKNRTERYTGIASSSLIIVGGYRIVEAGEIIVPRVYLIKSCQDEKWVKLEDIATIGDIFVYHLPGKIIKPVENRAIVTVSEDMGVLLSFGGNVTVTLEEFDYRQIGSTAVFKTRANSYAKLQKGISYRVCIEGTGSVYFHSGQDYEIDDEQRFLIKQGLHSREWEDNSAATGFNTLFKFALK
jgi:hypothetical protein